MTQSSFSILGLPVIRRQLASGLTLLLQPTTRAAICSVHIWVRTGSADDPSGLSGLAHFFEHLMFTGTPKYEEGEIDHWIEENGGHINAATWLDWTYYHGEMPSGLVHDYLEKEADRFRSLSLEPTRLERERQVVLNERREQVEDDPESLLSELLWYGALDGVGYGRPTIGSNEDIRRMTRNDCLAYYNRAYHPSNLIIAISGKFDEALVSQRIESGFDSEGDTAKIPKPSAHLNCYVPGNHGETTIATKTEKLYVGLPAPALQSVDHAALEIVHHTLLEGESGRLHRLLVSEAELATYAYGFLPSLSYDSLYEMGFDLRRTVPAETLLSALRLALDELIENGITEAELERAQNRIELDVVEGLQTVEQRAHSLGFWEAVVGDCRFTETRLSQYTALDTETVHEVIRRWWSIDQMSWTIGRCQD